MVNVDTCSFTPASNSNTRLPIHIRCHDSVRSDLLHWQLHIAMYHLLVTKHRSLAIAIDSYDESAKMKAAKYDDYDDDYDDDDDDDEAKQLRKKVSRLIMTDHDIWWKMNDSRKIRKKKKKIRGLV
jgi:hypothetical protein